MCGIAGIIGSVTENNRAALARMTNAVAHRGPDHAGFWTSSLDERGHGCLLGHRRLSIIDLSAAADQPMVDTVGGVAHTIVFNGEVYNFKDLRRDLESHGERVTSSGDTAVMLRLLAIEGPDAVRKLRGMFAFALWDDAQRRLVLARDPLGIKPLYVFKNPDASAEWSLLFASEVRALLASSLVARPRLDGRALASVLWNGLVVGPGTAVAGVESLRPGELRVLDARGNTARSERYWHIPRPSPSSVTEADLRDAVTESVRLHLISDVPLGIFLSGGIDSSAVANLAQRSSESPVHTFTLAFEEQQYNEGEFSKAIAKAIGTEHTEILLTEQRFAAALDSAIDSLDQPTFDGLNSYYISKAVHDAGLTVALVGTGGDELFGGYATFQALPKMLTWSARTRFVPSGLKRFGAALVSSMLARRNGPVPAQSRWAKLPHLVAAGDDLVRCYQLAYALYLPEFQDRLLLNRDATEAMESGLTREFDDELRHETAGRSALSAVSVLEQRVFLGERLLRDIDAASMAVSLETRLPLVDSAIAETVTGLNDAARFAPIGQKQMLRRIGLDGLDPMLFDRPKQGFVLPFENWIRRSLGRTMDETLRDPELARSVGLNPQAVADLWKAYQSGTAGLYWSRIWAVYILIRWCSRHGLALS